MKDGRKRNIFFILGLGLCAFPMISGMIESGKQNQLVRTYEQAMRSETNREKILEEARQYNDILNQTKGAVVGDLQDGILSEESYRNQLSTAGNGVMGAIEIPKIHVNLPIWHGTDEKVLVNGAGHLEGSSLPVGGESTRCVLTSHRGLPSSKLFTRLDELEEGDLFYIHVCGETLAYQVCSIEVIEPDEMDRLRIVPEKDMATLVTCTPYGINTHRLIVDGERVAYRKETHEKIKPEMFSVRELCFFLLPFVFVGAAVLKGWKGRRKKRCKNYEKKKMARKDYGSACSVVYSGRRERAGRRKRRNRYKKRGNSHKS